jgi:type I restriction enzyme S subunit
MVVLQEKIIEELKAYKQSVITEAVTKGLNPDVPMKDSGIEWIGEIPENWEKHPFKAFYKTTKGLNITKDNLVEKGVPVISYGQIHSKLNTGVGVREELIRFVPEYYLESNPECLSKQYDLFFADTSEDREGAGNIVFIDTETPIFAGYHTIIARPLEKVKSKYFAYLIKTNAWRSQIRNKVQGVKLFSISQKFINQTYIIIPSLQEQQSIASYLDEKCSEIDSLISIKQSKIESLKEYKKSIIYEYVTGKKEVI